tara:strand:+ start:3269 stop:5638 length:2370 start_codon:yes stop_codon:yes gene_type:complete
MKNNITTYLFLVMFASLNVCNSSANEFLFNTNEINILDNGNIINATDGVAKSIKDNIEIEAEEFEYIKNLSILNTSKGTVKSIQDSLEIKADKFQYNASQSTIVAIGNVEIKNLKNKLIIQSEKIFYDSKNNFIESNTDSIFENQIGNIFKSESFFYSFAESILKVTNIEIKDNENNIFNLNKAFINLESNKLIGKDISIDFNNESFLKDNEPRLSGVSVSADESQTTITKGIFTTCKRNDKCPPWKISAKEIKHDKKNKTINYTDAWLNIYDQPVLYFPKFFHPDPTVKRQSGFLMPRFGDSTSTGASFNLPYYIVLADNKDVTFKPRFFSDQKILLQSEYRVVNKKSNHIVDFSYKNEKNSKHKNHFFSKSSKIIDFYNFDETELNLELQKISDDTYLKTYKLKSPIINNVNTLTSSFGISAYKEDLNIDVDFKVFEDLSKKGNDRYEFLYPSYALTKYFNNSNYHLNSTGSMKNYDTNVYETIVINDFIYNSDSFISKNGLTNNYNFLIKNVNTDSRNSTRYKQDRDHKIMSIVEYNSSYPLIKKMKNYQNVLSPMVSLKFSPNNTKDLNNTDNRIDINNIFNINRIGQSDVVEGGASLTYGAKFSKIDKLDKEIFTANIANILRIDENEDLPRNSELGEKISAVVGEVSYAPSDIIKIKYNFSLDSNLNDKNYELFTSEFKLNNFITSFDYLNENNTSNKESYIANKTQYYINDSKNLTFETRKNKKTKLTEFYNLIYEYSNDCLKAAIEYNRDYYTDRDLKPDESLFFKLTIIPFGTTSSPNLK